MKLDRKNVFELATRNITCRGFIKSVVSNFRSVDRSLTRVEWVHRGDEEKKRKKIEKYYSRKEVR